MDDEDADQSDAAGEIALLADVFMMLHPATLPMLKRMFEEFRREANDDGEVQFVRQAEIAILAVDRAIADHEAVDT
jgi:hypothetical protein